MTERKSAHRDVALFPVIKLAYPYRLTTVFPASVDSPLPDANLVGGMLDHLLVVDYRYARFALDPRDGLFTMVRSVYSSRLLAEALNSSRSGIGGTQHGLEFAQSRTGWTEVSKLNVSLSLVRMSSTSKENLQCRYLWTRYICRLI